MGCAASARVGQTLTDAVAVQPAMAVTPAPAPRSVSAAKRPLKSALKRSKSNVGPPTPEELARQAAKALEALPPNVPHSDPPTADAVLDSFQAAEQLFAADHTPASLCLMQLDWSPLDNSIPASAPSPLCESDLDLLRRYLTHPSCSLFPPLGPGIPPVELSPQNLAQLVLVAPAGVGEGPVTGVGAGVGAGVGEAMRLLRRLDAEGVQCSSMSELPDAMAQLQRHEFGEQVSLLQPRDRQAMLDAFDFLAAPSCNLYSCAATPRVEVALSAASASPPSGPMTTKTEQQQQQREREAGKETEASAVEMELLGVNFELLNQQLVSARRRASFLSSYFLAYLLSAAGRAPGGSSSLLLGLQHLSLLDRPYSSPSELLRALASHRSLARQTRRALWARLHAHASWTDLNPRMNESMVQVPEGLDSRARALREAVGGVVPFLAALRPLFAPLPPILAELRPTLSHLQAYLTRFHSLLQQSTTAALDSNLLPEKDRPTAALLRMYLSPFLQLLLPWVQLLEPLLTCQLPPFFRALQQLLERVGEVFGMAQPFVRRLGELATASSSTSSSIASSSSSSSVSVASVAPTTTTSGYAFSPFSSPSPSPALVLLDPSLSRTLRHLIQWFAVLLPLLQRELRPFLHGLCEFCAECTTFLGEMQQMMLLMVVYDTEEGKVEATTKQQQQQQQKKKKDEEKEGGALGLKKQQRVHQLQQWDSSYSEPCTPVAATTAATIVASFVPPAAPAVPLGTAAAASAPKSATMTAAADWTAPQILSSDLYGGRTLRSLRPYVMTLRPFVAEVQGFVRQYGPFVDQLEPFYAEGIRGNLAPLLLFDMPTSGAQEQEQETGDEP